MNRTDTQALHRPKQRLHFTQKEIDMRDSMQYPKNPNYISFSEAATQNIRGVVLAMLAVLVPLVVLAMIIGGK